MLVFDTTTKSLEVILTAAVATNQLPFVVAYADVHQTSFKMLAMGCSDGATNNTTSVTMLAAPGATTSRQLKTMSLANVDTAPVELTVRYNNNGTRRTLWHGTLQIQDTLVYMDSMGWQVLDGLGNLKTGIAVESALAIDGTAAAPTVGELLERFITFRVDADGVWTVYSLVDGAIVAQTMGTLA